MGVEGIGASVVRKEDQRFITGKGRYVDDIKLQGMTYAHFVRSPHAHAKVKSIDSSAAMKMPGVVGVLTGQQIVDDKVGNLICGWAITSKDGSPMKMGAWPAMAPETVRFVGQAVAVVIAETKNQAKDAAEAVVVDYEELPAAADIRAAIKPGAPQLHPEAPGNVIYDWTIGDEAATRTPSSKAANVVVAGHSPTTGWCRTRWSRARRSPNTTRPKSISRSTRPRRIRMSRASCCRRSTTSPRSTSCGSMAPDVGGGFGSKIFIYPEEMVALWASKKVGRPVKWTGDRSEAFLTDAHGRDHITKAEMAFDKDNKILGLRVKTHANLGAYMSLFSSSVPTYLYATLLSGQYNIPAIYAEVITVYTNTTPVDAYRGAGRPEASFVVERLMETAARQLKVDPAELRRKNFITQFPHQTPVIMAYDIGDFGASLDAAMKAIDYAGFPARKAKAKSEGKLRGIGFSCYIEACGIAPVEGGRQPRRRRRPVGIRRSPRQSGRHHRDPDRLAQPRPGPRDHLRAAGRRTARHSDQPGPDRPWRHRQGAVRHGHLWLALGRGRRAPRSSRRWRRSKPRPRRSRRICSRRPKATSSSRTASSRSPAPTSRSRCRWSRSPPIPRTICPTAWSPA